jgi:hypothetical protein
MATIEQRYDAATRYVERAIDVVDNGPRVFDPLSAAIELYAGRTKTQYARVELRSIEARWLRATNDVDRARVARDAELLADRVEESLPGAPQDRARTNLYPGELPTGTAATSFDDEAQRQAHSVWTWLGDRADAATSEAKTVAKWLLVGGGVLVGWKALTLVRGRHRNRRSRAQARRVINERLAEVAAGEVQR